MNRGRYFFSSHLLQCDLRHRMSTMDWWTHRRTRRTRQTLKAHGVPKAGHIGTGGIHLQSKNCIERPRKGTHCTVRLGIHGKIVTAPLFPLPGQQHPPSQLINPDAPSGLHLLSPPILELSSIERFCRPPPLSLSLHVLTILEPDHCLHQPSPLESLQIVQPIPLTEDCRMAAVGFG